MQPAPSEPVTHQARDSAERRRFATHVGIVSLVSLVAYLVMQRFEPLPPDKAVVADEVWYVQVAHSLLEGKGFTWGPFHSQTALHDPLTVFLLLPATLFEPHGYTLQRATIAVLGALVVLVVGFVGRELAGPRVGVIAAVVAAVYPGLWVNDLVATSETPALLLISLIIYVVLRYRRERTVSQLVVLGVLAGLLALDRSELTVLAAVLIVPVIVTGARRAPQPVVAAVRGVVVVGVVAAVFVAPWSIYNSTRFTDTVLSSNNLGQTLVGANCPASYYGPLTGYNGPPDGAHCALPVLLAEIKAHPHGDESVADAYFRHEAITYALKHWHRWPVVAVMRELWLWSLWRPAWTVYIAGVYIGRARWAAWSQVIGFWLLAPVAIYGFVVARRRRILRWPLVSLVAFTAALGLLVVGNLRYRIPADLAACLLAAIAIDRVVPSRSHPVPLEGGGEVAAAAALDD